MSTLNRGLTGARRPTRTDPANDELAVLVVSDDSENLDEVAIRLHRRGLPVELAFGAAEARGLLARRPGVGVVVAGVGLLEGEGLELAAALVGGRGLAPAELLLVDGRDATGCGPALGRLGLLHEPLALNNIEQAVHQAMARAVTRRLPLATPA